MAEHIIRPDARDMAQQRDYMEAVRLHPRRPDSYYIVTYGCQMNAHDSETLAGMLTEMGLSPAASREEAGFVLHNTCCIRDNAERKALGNVTWLKEIKRDRPEMLIGVCGCMIQQPGMAQRVLSRYPFIDIAFGTGEVYRLPEYLYHAIDGGERVIRAQGEASVLAEGLPIRRDSPHKAYITIMQGCDNFCSYCIVPYVRGRERSRAAADILREAEGLVREGVKEVMLIGQNVNSYGADSASPAQRVTFAQLLRLVAQTGVERVRFMTSHPKDLSDELIEEMARNKAVAPHLHLPVQSGSDSVLAAMNRRYTREKYLERVAALRRAMPDIGLTTDFIVAFPGETEADFEETLSLASQVRFDSAFTFIFSPRRGTAAFDMPGRVPPDIAKERIERLIALQEGVTGDILRKMRGKTVRVLVEGVSKRRAGQLTGKCGRNISVNFTANDGDMASDVGQFINVRVTGAGSNTLRGEKEMST